MLNGRPIFGRSFFCARMKTFHWCFLLLTVAACDWLGPVQESVTGASADQVPWDTTGALPVVEVPEHIGEKQLTVRGYIVGGNLSTSAKGIRFEAPFTAATHLALADTAAVVLKSSCLAVQLPSGRVRDSLCLTVHPQWLGRKVWLRGDIVASYFGLPGLKNVTDFAWEMP